MEKDGRKEGRRGLKEQAEGNMLNIEFEGKR